MIKIVGRGSTAKTQAFLEAVSTKKLFGDLHPQAKKGVDALRNATPVRTGKTAKSWDYEIEIGTNSASIVWINSNEVAGTSVALLLQYGHGTGTGGYVQGQDYINPAIRPVCDKIIDDVWKKVTYG